MYVLVCGSAYYSAYKNGGMVVAGGRPIVAIESAVARCYDIMLHFSRIVCPCFMQNKQTRLR